MADEALNLGPSDEGRAEQSSERSLSREVLGVVEAAALAAGRLMGTGKRDGADEAAVTAMVVIGGKNSSNTTQIGRAHV